MRCRPASSGHRRVLVLGGLFSVRRDGRVRLYKAELEPLAELREWLDGYWDDRLAALKELAEQ